MAFSWHCLKLYIVYLLLHIISCQTKKRYALLLSEYQETFSCLTRQSQTSDFAPFCNSLHYTISVVWLFAAWLNTIRRCCGVFASLAPLYNTLGLRACWLTYLRAYGLLVHTIRYDTIRDTRCSLDQQAWFSHGPRPARPSRLAAPADSGSRRAPQQHGVQQQTRAASCCQLRQEAEHRHVFLKLYCIFHSIPRLAQYIIYMTRKCLLLIINQSISQSHWRRQEGGARAQVPPNGRAKKILLK